MNVFGVTPEKAGQLRARMAACGLREQDLDETFIRSGGPGGQKVNRSSTCVRLLHRPSGVEVKMQRERSQALNRFFARRRLCENAGRIIGRTARLGRTVQTSRRQIRAAPPGDGRQRFVCELRFKVQGFRFKVQKQPLNLEP